MADQVDEVKSKIDIVSLISEHIELKKAGRNYKALCPFHSEKSPSFIVSPEMQIFKCFGCSRSGDVITFLEEYEGMDFYEALKFLAARVGVTLKSFSGGKESEREKLYKINLLAARFYTYVLLNHPRGQEAIKYLTSQRGISIETIKTFQLGFSPDIPFAMKTFLVDKKKISLSDLERVGLIYLKDNRAFDRFRGRIIFPLYDHRGNVVGFSGRIIPGSPKADLKKYINTPETEIYHKSRILFGLNLTKADIKKTKKAVIMEGEIDLISSWQVGVKNAVAIKGSALTPDQVSLLARYADTLILALDADVAGNEAAKRGIEIASRQGLEIRVVSLTGFKDPDEAAQKAPDKLFDAIDKATNVWDFIIDSTFARLSGKTGLEKAKISKEIVPVLAKIQDKIVQAHYINLVARKLGVPVEAVGQQIEHLDYKEVSGPKVEKITEASKKTRRELLEERYLAIGLRYNPEVLVEEELKNLITTPFARRILKEFSLFSKEQKIFDPSIFAGGLPGELVGGFTDLVLKDLPGVEKESPEKLKKELGLLEKELLVLSVKEKLEDAAKRIREIEKSKIKDRKKLRVLQLEFGKLTKNLNELETG